MNTQEIKRVTELLKQSAGTKVFGDVMLMFSLRERARADVTLWGLKQRMEKAGFHYSNDDLSSVLKQLAGLGLGTLIFDSSTKKIVALRNIKWTLMSIGNAALGYPVDMKTFKKRNTFAKLGRAVTQALPSLPPPSDNKVISLPVAPSAGLKTMPPAIVTHGAEAHLLLAVTIRDKKISIPLPDDFTKDEISDLLQVFRKEQVANVK